MYIRKLLRSLCFLAPAVVITLAALAEAQPVIGDLNCDGAVNIVDVQVTINLALGITLNKDLDANGDGYLDECSPYDVGICGEGTALVDGYCKAKPCQCPIPSIPDMVGVPAGPFSMGCNAEVDDQCVSNEFPYHEVTLSAYEIDTTEVTVAEYAECLAAGGCNPGGTFDSVCNWGKAGKEQHPINCVSWFDAEGYCDWAGKRLCTEAEWEKAARSDDGRKYPWGNEPASCSFAIMSDGGNGCGTGGTWVVASKLQNASPYGAYDMAGNVWEWVSDWYDPNYYSSTPPTNPPGPINGVFRVLRGGSYGAPAGSLRTSIRNDSYKPDSAFGFIGFRCCK